MHTHIRPHAPSDTQTRTRARAHTHVHANTLTVCTQADADDDIDGLLLFTEDASPQAPREPTLPELAVEFVNVADARFGCTVDLDYAKQLLEVARSSPCRAPACRAWPRVVPRALRSHCRTRTVTWKRPSRHTAGFATRYV